MDSNLLINPYMAPIWAYNAKAGYQSAKETITNLKDTWDSRSLFKKGLGIVDATLSCASPIACVGLTIASLTDLVN